MIRAEAGTTVSRFLSVSFLELMSHFCNTDIIAPSREAKCELTEEEWYMRPWKDISVEVPPAVICELDGVEIDAINFGGVEEMRAEYMTNFQKNVNIGSDYDLKLDYDDESDLPF